MMKAFGFFQRTCLPIRLQQSPLRFCAPLRGFSHSKSSQSQQSPLLQLLFRNSRRTSVRHLFQKRLSSSKPPLNPTPHLNSPEPPLSLSQRFRKLSREYGWSALGVYLLLTAVDFPFCFLAVRWLGTERIGHWEHVIIEWFWSIIPSSIYVRKSTPAIKVEGAEEFGVVDAKTTEIAAPAYDHGVKEAEKMNQGERASELYSCS